MRAALATLLAAVLVGASCLLIAPSAQAVAPRAAAAGQHVMIQNYAYSPASLTVAAGVTVTWTNHDEAKHDVVGSGPASFRSPLLSKGQSWSYTFQVAGDYAYYCSLHPDMRGRVTTKAAAQQPAPQPQPQQPAQLPQAQQPAQPQAPASAAPSSTAKSRGSAAPPASSAPPVVVRQPVQQAAPATTQSIDPTLLIAGIVTGVAVLCLLLLGSRRPD